MSDNFPKELYKALCNIDSTIDVTVDGPTVGGHWFIAVSSETKKNNGINKSIVIEALLKSKWLNPYFEYGFTFLDDAVGYGDGADWSSRYIPTIVKYVELLLR